MNHVVQNALPSAPWMQEATRRLPGVQPLADPDGWLLRDEAFAGQMAIRDDLVDRRRPDVIAAVPGSEAALGELLAEVLSALGRQGGYVIGPGSIERPDGVEIARDEGDPLGLLARLVQQDLCVLQKSEGSDEHVLTAAALCFPASWTLAEKIGRGLTEIHDPVAPYDAAMGRRVQRLFHHIRVGRPLWRQNALIYSDPALHQPRPVAAPRTDRGGGGYLRSERQALLRLPVTGAVVFSIHTYLVPLEKLTPDQRAGLTDLSHAT